MAIGSYGYAPLRASALAALALCASTLAAQPFAHEKLITPTYVTLAPTYGDLELSGDLLAYGVREEIDTFPFAEGAVFLFGRDQGGPNNWGLLKKLASPVPTQGEGFGSAVELQGDELFVASFPLGSPGLVRVFGRDEGGVENWGILGEITESDAAFCEFGRSMDVEGDILVVGSNCGGGNTGQVFVYERDLGGAGNWGRRQVIVPSDIQVGDRFGVAVALSGTLLAVGAPDRGANDAGGVYLFRRDPVSGLWVQWRTLTDAASTNSHLGEQLALDGSTLLASRRGDNRISVYRCWHGGPGNWGYLGDLLPPAGVFSVTTYGESLAIDGALAVVGGSTSYFVYDVYDWSAIGVELQTLPASNGDHTLAFVAIAGERTAAAGALLVNTSNFVIDVFAAPTADLAVTVDDGQSVAFPSTTLTYDIVFSNAGAQAVTGAAFGVDLTPASLDLAGVFWTCATSPGAGAGTTCPLPSGDWNDLDDGGLTLGLEPGDSVTLTLDAPVLASPSDPPVECRSRVRTPAAQAVDPDGSDNGASDRDGFGGVLIFEGDFEAGDLLAWWKQTGCP